MFNNNKKTIGVFINRLENTFQSKFSKYLIRAAEEKDFNIAFMSSYGIRGNRNMYDSYENAIVDFAPIEKFDALIAAMDTYDTPLFRNKLISSLRDRAVGPVVAVREKCDDFFCVLTDANKATTTILDHLTKEHNKKIIFFMAGYEGHYDSTVRLNYYLDYMKKNRLPIYHNSMFFGDMWNGKGEEAYKYFFSDPEVQPEVIICANDFMARTMCDILQKNNIKVPESVFVTGYDNSPEAVEYEPALTTVAMDYKEMAQATIDMIYDLIVKGEKRQQFFHVPSKIKYRASCGCAEKDKTREDYLSEHYRRTNTFLEKHTQQTFFSIDLDVCNDIDEMKEVISSNLDIVGDYDEFFLCLLEQPGGIKSYTGDLDVKMKMGYRRGKEITQEELLFKQNQLLPDCISTQDNKVYYFRILHNREKNFGYTVISFKNKSDTLDMFYHEWNLTISLALNEHFIRRKILNLLKINEENSIRDYMTMMYNRRGIEKIVESKWSDWIKEKTLITFLSIDLDGLKYINDNFGHSQGDKAIVIVAKAIQEAIKDLETSAYCARMGGDEFLIIMETKSASSVEKVKISIKNTVSRYNQFEKNEYDVSFSIGSYITNLDKNTSYDDCVCRCDTEMYINKKQKKDEIIL